MVAFPEIQKTRSAFKKRGFTLLELIVVIVIIGILATLGYTQYSRTLEKMRTAEAKTNIGTMIKLAYSYYMVNGTYSTITNADVGVGTPPGQLPSSCTSTNYFKYLIRDNGANKELSADRCTSGGKTPQWTGGSFYQVYATAVEATGSINPIACWASDNSCQNAGFY